MATTEELTALHRSYEAQSTCLLKHTATQAVYGSGNPNAAVVLIGEAPGKKEDETGVPFVGAAGKLLDEMLASIGMARSSVYITNIVKYRPPNNRDPLPHEKDACRAWLHAELAAINPRLIVFLGRHAMNDFFPEEKISAVHGKLLVKQFPDISTTHFLPLYHPAAALYNGALRDTLTTDFAQIPKILKKLEK
jgi:DNA polymerase